MQFWNMYPIVKLTRTNVHITRAGLFLIPLDAVIYFERNDDDEVECRIQIDD